MKTIVFILMITFGVSSANIAIGAVSQIRAELNFVQKQEKNNNVIFTLFPNPCNGIVNIKFADEGNYKIEIFDLLGNRILSISIKNQSIYILDLTQQAKKGYFLVQITNQNAEISTCKLLIQ